MASRIQACFERLRTSGRRAFIPYVTAGDPDLETTAAILDALADNGADVIELGVPFSDPMADGPVIQAAMTRALASGTTFAGVLEVVRGFRARHPDTPVVLFGYLNPLYRQGLEAACSRAAEAGADGFLVVDLPPEEAAQLTVHTRAAGLDFIALFTPTSDDARIAAIGAHASGFAYYVSVGGVTGDTLSDFAAVEARAEKVRELTGLPICVGFGIRSGEDAARVGRFADGAVVGTAMVAAIEAADRGGEAAAAGALTATFRAALDAG